MKVRSITKCVLNVLPNVITQVIQFDNCTNKCPECHSKHLWEDNSREMTLETLEQELIPAEDIPDVTIYGENVSDAKSVNEEEFIELLKFLHTKGYKVSVWSGRNDITEFHSILPYCDSFKIGRYDGKLGGLEKETTNQIFYTIKDGDYENMKDETYLFQQQAKEVL